MGYKLIKLVKNDNRPIITLTVALDDGSLVSLVGATEVIHFRKRGTTTVLSTLSCTHVTDGSDGKTYFKFTGAALDVDSGMYEGELEITYGDGDKQSVYDVLRFRVRDEFA